MSGGPLKRRQFASLLAGAAMGWPLAARAQTSPLLVVGFLAAASARAWTSYVDAFRRGLGEHDFVEGRNVAIEFRWAEGHYGRLTALAADLVRRNVAVIVATGGIASVRAALAATKTIPIVFTLGADPVEQGIVATLGRPGGNATGVTMFTAHLPPKRLELLHEIVPKAAKIAVLFNPGNNATPMMARRLESTARALNRQLVVVYASDESELEKAFEDIARQRAGGVVVSTDAVFDAARAEFARLAIRHSLPTIHGWRDDAVAGGLMSYGPSLKHSYQRAGTFTARVLKGAKPSEMPIEQSSKFELVVNLRTAKALGIGLPPALLARADDVIE